MSDLAHASEFFRVARERYEIRLRRLAGHPPPWTTDIVLASWRFCQVHREHDKTTEWFRTEVRGPLSEAYQQKPTPENLFKIIEATVIFRWFNRIETGEIIKDLLLGEWSTPEARRRLTGVNPVVTGAYIVKGPDGFTKLEGVLHCVDLALPQLRQLSMTWGHSLEQAWLDLCEQYYLAGFMSYEIVSDLRWTPVLSEAKDIGTWANAGPGAARGLGWIIAGRDQSERTDRLFNPGSASHQLEMLRHMRELLQMSRDPQHWPIEWHPWEMREVEHWLCEFDKYQRAAVSGLRLKRRYV